MKMYQILSHLKSTFLNVLLAKLYKKWFIKLKKCFLKLFKHTILTSEWLKLAKIKFCVKFDKFLNAISF